MTKGFVFGKFLPFHIGHKALIEFGENHCDELTVLVCASYEESISGSVRSKWISDTFKGNPKIKVVEFQYDESMLPNTSESSKEISKIWAKQFSKLIPGVTMLFTSEPYGAYVAEFMGINHVSFNEDRTDFSISGSLIRNSLLENWDYLPDCVKSYFQKKIVILGTESVGKSTLAEYLSNQFRSSFINELGRDIIPNSKYFTKDQLKQIAEGHVKNINEAIKSLQPLIIIDTDIHITQSYANHTFGNYLNLPDSIYANSRADLYLYLKKDVPYIQDGSRLDENVRNKLDQSHKATLDHFGIKYEQLTGGYEERNQKAYQLVKDMMNRFN